MGKNHRKSRAVKAPKPQCALERLPVELKILILSQLEDVRTLYKMVRTSPAYHAAYLAARREILTRVTLRHLISTRNMDILDRAPVVELAVHRNYFISDYLSELIAIIKDARRQHKNGRRIILEVEQCTTLRKLRDYVPWKIVQRHGTTVAECDELGIYERSKDHTYRPVYFKDENEYSVDEVDKMYEDAIRRDNEVILQRGRNLALAMYGRRR